ncbi:hypothetical protein [Granulicella aggregans]|jgi:hypothetical protein|uniref:hypothetical protein n=1 Tax=Granulicella aggregans TaxID=474949 RepID=UPI0021E0D78C|nr:hypothetical protein [Granulicella aggregans]
MKNEVKGVSAESVERQLSRLRNSPLFSHSRRYPIFLDYVVRKTLDGHGDQLKERTVGVEAFGRPSSYDLNADPVVRVTAGEVRKRLAQYYYEPDHQHELRIELRPGSYVPEFRLVGETPGFATEAALDPVETSVVEDAGRVDSPPSTSVTIQPLPSLAVPDTALSPQARKWRRVAACFGVALLFATGGAVLPLLHRPSATDTFWRPVVEANGPVLISVASVVAMVNSNAVAPNPSSVSGHPLALDPIAISDATALSSIQQVLSVREKTSTLESSTGTSFADLQKGPVVLISGFNNQWTMRITNPLRFYFVRTSTDDYTIQDRTNPKQVWGINTAGPFVKMDRDFGIVARFHDPTTEQIVVVAAGIGENGTIAASRFLTDERYLSELKRERRLPLPEQNFEAVVETQIIDGKPGPPRVVATYLW